MAKRKTASEKLDDAKAEVQARAIAQILIATCALLDDMLTQVEPVVELRFLLPVVLKMETYLDGRERGRDPVWVARLRRTVTRFKIRLKLDRNVAAAELH